MSNELATTTATPMSLLAIAVKDGHDPDRLRQLMDLQERWEKSQAVKEYAAAMHECQKAMPRIVRDKQNTHTKASYGSLEQVQRSAQPVYTAHGFSLSYGEADCPVANHKRTVCDVRHVGGHCERYHLDLPIDGAGSGNRAAMNAVQGAISTTSYAQRRLLCMIFNITLTDEDDDGQGCAVVTPQEADQLQDWIDATGTNLSNFLKWAGCGSLAMFPADKYDEAVEYLKRKGAK